MSVRVTTKVEGNVELRQHQMGTNGFGLKVNQSVSKRIFFSTFQHSVHTENVAFLFAWFFSVYRVNRALQIESGEGSVAQC